MVSLFKNRSTSSRGKRLPLILVLMCSGAMVLGGCSGEKDLEPEGTEAPGPGSPTPGTPGTPGTPEETTSTMQIRFPNGQGITSLSLKVTLDGEEQPETLVSQEGGMELVDLDIGTEVTIEYSGFGNAEIKTGNVIRGRFDYCASTPITFTALPGEHAYFLPPCVRTGDDIPECQEHGDVDCVIPRSLGSLGMRAATAPIGLSEAARPKSGSGAAWMEPCTKAEDFGSSQLTDCYVEDGSTEFLEAATCSTGEEAIIEIRSGNECFFAGDDANLKLRESDSFENLRATEAIGPVPELVLQDCGALDADQQDDDIVDEDVIKVLKDCTVPKDSTDPKDSSPWHAVRVKDWKPENMSAAVTDTYGNGTEKKGTFPSDGNFLSDRTDLTFPSEISFGRDLHSGNTLGIFNKYGDLIELGTTFVAIANGKTAHLTRGTRLLGLQGTAAPLELQVAPLTKVKSADAAAEKTVYGEFTPHCANRLMQGGDYSKPEHPTLMDFLSSDHQRSNHPRPLSRCDTGSQWSLIDREGLEPTQPDADKNQLLRDNLANRVWSEVTPRPNGNDHSKDFKREKLGEFGDSQTANAHARCSQVFVGKGLANRMRVPSVAEVLLAYHNGIFFQFYSAKSSDGEGWQLSGGGIGEASSIPSASEFSDATDESLDAYRDPVADLYIWAQDRGPDGGVIQTAAVNPLTGKVIIVSPNDVDDHHYFTMCTADFQADQ